MWRDNGSAAAVSIASRGSGAAWQDEAGARSLSICVVGGGTRFLSGISYYTNRLIAAFGERHRVSAILIRQMMPSRLYPGRARVGKPLTRFTYPPGSVVFDGIDWYWGPSIFAAIRLLLRERPDVLVLQWWTATVLHSYLAIAAVARILGSRVVIEFHEVLDTAELKMRPVRWYIRLFAPLLIRLARGFVVHNEFDRQALSQRYQIGQRPIAMLPHGPYDQYRSSVSTSLPDDGICQLLYFGVIRPFKGVEDIVSALELMSDEEASRFHLTVVGETWEGWTVPAERIASSPRRERITFVNRYVSDEEVAGFFARASAVVLPYHRSSASGPLHIAMACGLPVVITAVGGLIEATEGYEGAVRIPPRDPAAIREAILRIGASERARFQDIHSWERTVEGYERLFSAAGVRRPPLPRPTGLAAA